MSLVLHDKISVGEAMEWLKNAKESWNAGGVPDEEEFLQVISDLRPVDFKAPRKPRVSKKSSSSSERAEMVYDEAKCDARVWNDSLGAQCSKKKIAGQCLCSMHQKHSEKHDGELKEGLINAERPTHHYGDAGGKLIPWHDVVGDKKKKGGGPKKSSKQRNCSNCGECGHNKRNCPQSELADVTEEELTSLPVSKLMKHARSVGVSPAKLDTASDSDDVRGAIVELIQVAKLKKAKEEEEKNSLQDILADEVVDEAADHVSKSEFGAAREGLAQAIATSSSEDARLARLESMESPAPEEEMEEDLSLTDDETATDSGAGTGLSPWPTLSETAGSGAEEDTSTTTITFEGVGYTLTDENKVLDDEYDEVGEWDGEEVINWTRTGSKYHRMAKAAL